MSKSQDKSQEPEKTAAQIRGSKEVPIFFRVPPEFRRALKLMVLEDRTTLSEKMRELAIGYMETKAKVAGVDLQFLLQKSGKKEKG